MTNSTVQRTYTVLYAEYIRTLQHSTFINFKKVMLSSSNIKTIGSAKIVHQLAATERKLQEISSKLSRLQPLDLGRQSTTGAVVSNPPHSVPQAAVQRNEESVDMFQTSYSARPEWDWTRSYSSWNSWEDIDELQNMKLQEEMKIESIQSKRELLTHNHDHSKEREFYELADEKKIQTCEIHRLLGNHLFHEGWFSKALDHYQIAVGLYEYCFPTDAMQQEELDRLRHICLCNMSLCLMHLGLYRRAVESSSTVLRECADSMVCSKALFRRAQAYRCLDEYELALADLRAVNEMVPHNRSIATEVQLLRCLFSSNTRSQQVFAHAALTMSTHPTHDGSSGPEATSPQRGANSLYSMSMVRTHVHASDCQM
jgi:tetratricopeptide (TPR) repeat protein